MTRIYAIRTGEYSDQSWGPVFSTAERAQAYATDHNKRVVGEWGRAEVEIHTIDEGIDTGPERSEWAILFDSEGNVLETQGDSKHVEAYEPVIHDAKIVTEYADKVENQRWYLISETRHPDRHVVVSGIYATDEAHAIKIAIDRRFAFLSLPGLNMVERRI